MTWRPLGELPNDRVMRVLIRTAPDAAVTTWRWHPYARGSQPPFVGGRWQVNARHGYRNAPLPDEGEWEELP